MTCECVCAGFNQKHPKSYCARCGKNFYVPHFIIEDLGCCKNCMTDEEQYDLCAPWISKMFKGIEAQERKNIIKDLMWEAVVKQVKSLKKRGYI